MPRFFVCLDSSYAWILRMPELFEVNRRISVGLKIEEIISIAEYSLDGEWKGQVQFLPLK